MSWLARSIANSMRLDEDESETENDGSSRPQSSTANDEIIHHHQRNSQSSSSNHERYNQHQRGYGREEEIQSVSSNSESSSEEDFQSRGVKDDLTELKQTFTRQIWGVASFLAPHPPPEPPVASCSRSEDRGNSNLNRSEPCVASVFENGGENIVSAGDSGIRSDFAEIRGRFRSGVTGIHKMASNYFPFGSDESIQESRDRGCLDENDRGRLDDENDRGRLDENGRERMVENGRERLDEDDQRRGEDDGERLGDDNGERRDEYEGEGLEQYEGERLEQYDGERRGEYDVERRDEYDRERLDEYDRERLEQYEGESLEENDRDRLEESEYSEELEEEEEFVENAIGITDEVLTFAGNIAMHPETWLDFPHDEEEELEDFEMSDAQRGHAMAIERLAPRLAALRIELSPCHMSESYFWKVYFVLLHSRLNKHDAEALSTPQVIEARSVWMQELHKLTKPETNWFGRNISTSKDEKNLHELEHIPSSSIYAPPEFLSPRIYAFEPPSIMTLDYDTIKHSVESSSTDVIKFIDKTVIEEKTVIETEDKNLTEEGSSSKTQVQDYEDDEDDDWPDDEDSDFGGYQHVPICYEDEEDISFSDLEKDDDDLCTTLPIKSVK